MTETETLERARHALEAHAWEQAYEAFLALDEQGLSSDDLERVPGTFQGLGLAQRGLLSAG